MKTLKLVALVLMLGLFHDCDQPVTEDSADLGHLTVTVISSYYRDAQPGCLVQLIGTEYIDTTDAYGQVYFPDLEPGVYEVLAGLQSMGSAKTRVNVEAGALASVEMTLISGLLMEPDINIQTPDWGDLYAVNDTIHLLAVVSDNLTRPQDLLVTWSSNRDGLLYEGHPTSAGLVEYDAINLQIGEHMITMTALDSDGYMGKDSVIIDKILPPRVHLSLVSASTDRIQLSWSKSIDTTFVAYKVYRKDAAGSSNNLENLAVMSDVDSVSFVDLAPPMADSTVYQVFVENSSGYSSSSNEIIVPHPGGVIHDIDMSYSAIHPTQPWLYIVNAADEIFILDYVADSILSEHYFNTDINYFCVDDNGLGAEVYLPSSDGWINVYSEDLSENRLNINVGDAVSSVITDRNGHVFASCSPSPWWDGPLRSYRRSDGGHIGDSGDFDRCRLRQIPGQNAIIEITFSVSPVDMDYYEFDSDGNFTLHLNDNYHGDHPLSGSIFRMSPSGEYLITSGQAAIYTANSGMTYLGTLPRGTYYFSDYAYSDDGSRIYAAVNDERKLVVYDYPSLQFVEEIPTKGYPLKLYRQAGKLVIICATSVPSSWNTNYKLGIQVVPLSP